jgi:hypothetical protein
MTADYAALEARVAELERQMRHVLPGKIDAANYALSLVHADTQAIRAQLGEHGELLQAILQRLPPEPDGNGSRPAGP